jgi:hypothetical protein
MLVTAEEQVVFRGNVLEVVNLGIESQEATHKRIVPRTSKSRQLYEQFLAHGGLGLLQPYNEGTDPYVDFVGKLDEVRIDPVIFKGGVEWSKYTTTVDINGFVRSLGPMLRDSAVATRNKQVIDFIMAGFPGGTSLVPGNKTLFASDHDAGSGQTQSNSATSALDYTSLMAGCIAIARQRGRRSVPRTDPGSLDLIYGPANIDAAQVAARSTNGRPGTSDGDAHKHLNDMIGSLIRDNWIDFDSATRGAWILKPSSEEKSPFSYLELQSVDVVPDVDEKKGSFGMYADFWGAYFATHHFGIYGSLV